MHFCQEYDISHLSTKKYPMQIATLTAVTILGNGGISPTN
jgi:hypothetical protein